MSSDKSLRRTQCWQRPRALSPSLRSASPSIFREGVVGMAVQPAFARFGRRDDRMLRRERVLAGMPVGRTVAATRPPALLAGAQVYPLRAYLYKGLPRKLGSAPGVSRATRREPLLRAQNGVSTEKPASGLRTNHSSVRPQGVDDLQAREVSFVFGDNHAIIRFSDCGNDHVEGAPGPPFLPCRRPSAAPRPSRPFRRTGALGRRRALAGPRGRKTNAPTPWASFRRASPVFRGGSQPLSAKR